MLIFSLILFSLLFIKIRKRTAVMILISAVLCISVPCLIISADRYLNNYVRFCDSDKNEFVVLGTQGNNILLDFSSSRSSDAYAATDFLSDNGITELDSVVFSNFCTERGAVLEKLCSSVKIRNIYVPKPNINYKDTYNEMKDISEEYGSVISIYNSKIELGNIEIKMLKTDDGEKYGGCCINYFSSPVCLYISGLGITYKDKKMSLAFCEIVIYGDENNKGGCIFEAYLPKNVRRIILSDTYENFSYKSENDKIKITYGSGNAKFK